MRPTSLPSDEWKIHSEAPESTMASDLLLGGECLAMFDICAGNDASQSNPPSLFGRILHGNLNVHLNRKREPLRWSPNQYRIRNPSCLALLDDFFVSRSRGNNSAFILRKCDPRIQRRSAQCFKPRIVE